MTMEVPFNPTMVRLLLSKPSNLLTPSRVFQSHNGAIAAWRCLDAAPQAHVFQSHNGAIAASSGDRLLSQLRTFNPTMVRLLPTRLLDQLDGKFNFQSHNGAIAARRCPSTLNNFGNTFNPTMVRLLPISIPRVELMDGTFNPTMVRLLLKLPCVRS